MYLPFIGLLGALACVEPQYGDLPAGDSGTPADGGTPGTTQQPLVDCPVDDATPPEDIATTDWTRAVGLQGGDIEQIRVSATARDIVWAASAQNGLWRSEDAGRTWRIAFTFNSHTYGQVALHGSDPDILAYSTDQGWITTDGGANFQAFGLTWTGSETAVRGLAFDGDQLYAVQLSGQVHRSDDFGLTWQALGTLPPPASHLAPPSGGHDEKEDLWLAVTDSGTVLAASSGNGLYRSTDRGETFSEVLPVNISGALLAVSGDSVVVGAAGDTSTEVYASDDGGASWVARARVEAELVSVWLGEDGELLGTTPAGFWSEADGLVTLGGQSWGRYAAIARVGEGDLLIGHRLGVLGSTDDGQSFSEWSDEMVDRDLINLAVHPACPGLVFTGTQCRSGLYRSLDYGQTFDRPMYADMHYTMTTVVSPSSPEQIWSASDDVLWRSSDLGETWIALNPATGTGGVHLHGLGVHPELPERVIVGSVGSGDFADDQAHLYATEDGGETWQALGEGLPDTEESFHAIHFAREDPDVVLLGTFPAGEGVTHAGGDGVGLYRSEDGGQAWTKVDVPALSVQIFAECQGRIYAGADLGLLRSDDRGATWSTVLAGSDGVKNVACHGDLVLALDPGWGVQRSDDGGDSWSDWTGSLDVTLGEINNQVGLEISPDGRFAYAVVPNRGFSMRSLEAH